MLIKELQSLGLDVKVLDKANQEIDLKQTFDDEDDIGLNIPEPEVLPDEMLEPNNVLPFTLDNENGGEESDDPDEEIGLESGVDDLDDEELLPDDEELETVID